MGSLSLPGWVVHSARQFNSCEINMAQAFPQTPWKFPLVWSVSFKWIHVLCPLVLGDHLFMRDLPLPGAPDLCAPAPQVPHHLRYTPTPLHSQHTMLGQNYGLESGTLGVLAVRRCVIFMDFIVKNQRIGQHYGSAGNSRAMTG